MYFHKTAIISKKKYYLTIVFFKSEKEWSLSVADKFIQPLYTHITHHTIYSKVLNMQNRL